MPIDGSATFAELSEATGIDEDRLSEYLPTQQYYVVVGSASLTRNTL